MSGIKITADLAKTVNEYLGATFISTSDIGKTLVDKVDDPQRNPDNSTLGKKGDGAIGIAYSGNGTGFEKVLRFQPSPWSGQTAEISGFFCAHVAGSASFNCGRQRTWAYASVDESKAALLIGALFGFDQLPQQTLNEIDDPAQIEAALTIFAPFTAEPEPEASTKAEDITCP